MLALVIGAVMPFLIEEVGINFVLLISSANLALITLAVADK